MSGLNKKYAPYTPPIHNGGKNEKKSRGKTMHEWSSLEKAPTT